MSEEKEFMILTLEKENDHYIISDNRFSNYGLGDTPADAFHDFLHTSLEYLQIVGPKGFEEKQIIPEHKQTCEMCKQIFVHYKSNKRFCSKLCRDAYYKTPLYLNSLKHR